MSDEKRPNFGLSAESKQKLLKQMRERSAGSGKAASRPIAPLVADIPDSLCDFSQMPGYKKMLITISIAEQAGVANPWFQCHDGLAKGETSIGGKVYLNFSTYDYLDINGSERVNSAAAEAMKRYGTSATASRLSSGERPPHRELEKALAELYSTEDCLTYVSGHSANVWTISQLFTRSDLVIYDALSHNSIIQGGIVSGAHRIAFPHNDYDVLEEILATQRASHKRALIVTEGLFSMDGDLPDLPRLLDLKKRYKCFLMIDEAHSLGVIGATGKGVFEHFQCDPRGVDIWMGTLSKTLCGCGGYIAGSRVLVEYLKYNSPGFVYSVAMPPPLAAASVEALRMMHDEPQRVSRVQEMGRFFLEYARKAGLDTGKAQGFSVIPVVVGNSLVAGLLASSMQSRRVNVAPIIYPTVEDSSARLRFFVTAAHTEEQIRKAVDICVEELPRARRQAESYSSEYL